MNSVKLVFFRARKSAFYWASVAVFGVLGIVSAALSATSFKESGCLAHLLLLPLGMVPFSSESIFSSAFLPPFPFFLLSIGFASVFCGEEYRLGTIKSQALSGKSRARVFLSMLLAALLLALSLVVAFQLFASLFSLFLGVPFYPEEGILLGNGEMNPSTLGRGLWLSAFLESYGVILLAYLSCFCACFAFASIAKNGWMGVAFGAILFVAMFAIGMAFFSSASASLSPDGAKPAPAMAELWLPHFWLRCFYALGQNCVYEFLGGGDFATRHDLHGFLVLAATLEPALLLVSSLAFGAMAFRKVDLR